MITGYNTDVRHGQVVFHVQTEDKGRENPTIESLVYVGGRVIAARRTGYAELLGNGPEDQAIIARMDRQHRTMIAAIRHGKFDRRVEELEAKRTAAGEPPLSDAPRGTAPPAAAEVAPPPPAGSRPVAAITPPADAPPADAAPADTAPADAAPADPASPPPPAPGARPDPPSAAAAASSGPRPVPAPEPPSAARRDAPTDNGDRTLDQVILDYLASEAEQEQLLLTLEEGRDLAVGRRGRLALRAASSRGGEPVGGAEVGVRLISTVAEPRPLARGVTGTDGGLRLEFDIPSTGRGTAALIVTAVSPIGRAELKQLL